MAEVKPAPVVIPPGVKKVENVTVTKQVDKVEEIEEVVEPFVPPEFVVCKNISRNTMYGIDGEVKVGSTGKFTFTDFCNFSTYLVEE
jgi:hypothetical protein